MDINDVLLSHYEVLHRMRTAEEAVKQTCVDSCETEKGEEKAVSEAVSDELYATHSDPRPTVAAITEQLHQADERRALISRIHLWRSVYETVSLCTMVGR
jgi:hypothetical protein